MENVLQKIINKKKERIKICKSNYSESTILENIKTINNFVNFKDEIKKKIYLIKSQSYLRLKKLAPLLVKF